jgi:hypothetical protein
MPGPTLEPWEVTRDYEGTLAALVGRRVSVVSSDRDPDDERLTGFMPTSGVSG